MTHDFDALVAGAGVVGLAVARLLAERGRSVLVIEPHPDIGWETSSRNSEVIHAGIYYAQGSLKARCCVAGKHWLYEYCAERGVPHKNTGKLIVASEHSEISALEGIIDKAARNGVTDLTLLDGADARALEPALACEAAVLSPSTGIIDSHTLMLSFQGDAQAHGAVFAFHTTLDALTPLDGGGFHARAFDERRQSVEVTVGMVVNAAGLGAQGLASRIEGLPAEHIPIRHLSRGCYFAMTGRAPFSRLIYPAPRPESLGIHLTIDLGGRCKFGPDHEWIETENYDVCPRRAEQFYDAIRRYYPALPDGALQPDYAGIRPKIQAPGEPAQDFRIDGPECHGIPGLVNLFGIESPGLTASPALAQIVAERLGVEASATAPYPPPSPRR